MVGGNIMQIKTTSYQDIVDSLCQMLDLKEQEIINIIDSCYYMFQQDYQILVLDDQYDYFKTIVQKYIKNKIDKLYFYHISRRLNDVDDNGYSLSKVLTGNTKLAEYLSTNGLTFEYADRLNMYVNSSKVNIYNTEKYTPYLKYRFERDYSFKGYAFADQLQNNDMVKIAEGGPEFFCHLYQFIKNDDLIDHFIEQSKLYRFEYLVPIEDVFFEDYDELTNDEKQLHIIIRALQRLYFYKYDSNFIKYDGDNPIMGIVGDKTLSKKYLISKTEIKI